MPQVWDDQKDLLRAFNDNGVEYLVVGGHAVSHHAEPRTTKDLDLLIRNSEPNSRAVYRALAEFGAPLGEISPQNFREPDAIFQVGVEPSRIDIFQSISGVNTEEAWERRVPAEIRKIASPRNSSLPVTCLQQSWRQAGRRIWRMLQRSQQHNAL